MFTGNMRYAFLNFCIQNEKTFISASTIQEMFSAINEINASFSFESIAKTWPGHRNENATQN